MVPMKRREFFAASGGASILAPSVLSAAGSSRPDMAPLPEDKGAQRLSVEKLHAWESWTYGMFIHFGMSTFVNNELPDGLAPASTYNPDKLDVDSWIQIAQDAGMTYAVLTTKHVAGHCLWPTRYNDYNVTKSGNTTDAVEAFVKACAKRGVRPGFYYCSWDNHNRFGSQTPSDKPGFAAASTTSVYQTFQTNQITELLTQYGPIAEMWVDIPGVLGRGYRTFLYRYMADLQPDCVIMMNNGFYDKDNYDVAYAWPSDIIAIERGLPAGGGFSKWREIEGRRYYMPGEVCDPLGKDWFFVEGDKPRSDADLAGQLTRCLENRINLLLDVPPDKHGLLPAESRDALLRLRKNVKL
jgi:alpha-L-fucosidase